MLGLCGGVYFGYDSGLEIDVVAFEKLLEGLV